MTLAPVGISTYARTEHLRRTVDALRGNELASRTELFIFSDGPRPGDEDKVAAIREFAHEIQGFGAVNVLARESNDRIQNNRGGMRMLLEQFGRMIFLEEDVVTAPGFLTFMNEGLDRYRDDASVFSLTGYCPPIDIPADYRHDAFVLPRFNAWGFGLWQDRFEDIRYVTPEAYAAMRSDAASVDRFTRGGEDMLLLLEREIAGDIDALDVKAMFAQFESNQLTVYPTRSLSRNIGNDGTGLHCQRTSRFDVVLSDQRRFNWPDVLEIDPRILQANARFRRLPGIAERLRLSIARRLRSVLG